MPLDQMQAQFGHHVRKKRKLLRITQGELAQRVGTSQAAIAQIELGKGNATLKMIQRVSDALDLSMSLIIKPTPKPESKPPKWLST